MPISQAGGVVYRVRENFNRSRPPDIVPVYISSISAKRVVHTAGTFDTPYLVAYHYANYQMVLQEWRRVAADWYKGRVNGTSTANQGQGG